MPAQTLDTNYFGSSIVLEGGQHRDEVFLFAGAGTILKGTLLGRITASGKIKPVVLGANDGSQNPIGVATYPIEATGAGDVAGRMCVRGMVNRNRLILSADGNGNNITAAILDQLRDYGITPIDVQVVGQVL